MNRLQKYCVLDYETRSEAVLVSRSGKIPAVGAYEYARHPSTRIRCAAWRTGTRETLKHRRTKGWCPRIGFGSKEELIRVLKDPSYVIVAHNVFFERMITLFVLGIDVPIERWECSAALSASYALPRKLEGVCDALKLPIRKDPKGKLLIQRHCKPRKPTKKNPSKWNNDPEGLAELLDYCMTDVDAEVGVFLTLNPLSKSEREVWELDQLMNFRGIQVDRAAVTKIQKVITAEIERLTKQVRIVTRGEISEATKRDQAMRWLAREGAALPNLQKKTVNDAIESGKLPERATKFLKLRQSISKTSTAKYWAFEARTRTDSRLRDFQLFRGASTGRFIGTGVQPHNFPRGTLKDPDDAILALLTGDRPYIRALYGDVIEAASSCLRGMITADRGERLYAGDFNAIEARVAFWLARHDDGLALFGEGRDPYREMAAVIYQVRLADVTPAQREVGKRAILGCGYGMGWKKFQSTCKDFGTPVTDQVAKRAVKAYRTQHKKVVNMWYAYERAAIAAVQNPGKRISQNRVTWFLRGKFLFCELPSGRRLTYYDPTIRFEKTPWGEKRPKLYHWDIHPKTKQWVNAGTYGGKLTENIDQATACDLMVAAMLRAEKRRFKVMITVHDEIVASSKKAGRLKEFEDLMAEIPPWARGLPVKVKGFESFRYRKD